VRFEVPADRRVKGRSLGRFVLSRDALLIAEYALVRTACVGDEEGDDHVQYRRQQTGAGIQKGKEKVEDLYFS
jgi:hypothetical protein